MEIKGKKALVTGGSRGIGRAIALALSEKGANVSIFYRSSDIEAKKVAEQTKGLFLRVNLKVVDEIKKAVNKVISEFGGIDILV
ncbi:MAG TPA: SDR family NAD(P)-dependent oxidoreductase, partial [Candidatus Atribacteria bacterium]|nr:SDR family NAD(P)-dependent oxidoreductase [Candidatus Atribacteria bacterium]